MLLGGVPAEICRVYPQRQVSHAARGPNPQMTAGCLVCLFHITAWLFEGFPPRPSLPEKDWVIPAPTLITKPSLPSAGLYIMRCLLGGGHEPAALTQTPTLCGPLSNKRPVTEALAEAQLTAGTVRGHLTAGHTREETRHRGNSGSRPVGGSGFMTVHFCCVSVILGIISREHGNTKVLLFLDKIRGTRFLWMDKLEF